MTTATQTQTRITGPHKNRLKWGIEAYETGQWVEVAATEGSRKDAERLEREIAAEREQEITTAILTQPTITLSNFRVTYRAPRYGDGKVFYDGYCAILADSVEHDGAEVRVFDVPDADEGQLAAALFACDAMNQHERLIDTIKKLGHNAADGSGVCFCDVDDRVFGHSQRCRSIRGILATTTSK